MEWKPYSETWFNGMYTILISSCSWIVWIPVLCSSEKLFLTSSFIKQNISFYLTIPLAFLVQALVFTISLRNSDLMDKNDLQLDGSIPLRYSCKLMPSQWTKLIVRNQPNYCLGLTFLRFESWKLRATTEFLFATF